jgi:hypothetical protein
MIFHAFQREDDDSVFTVVRNVAGSALAVGDPCELSVASGVDGVRVNTCAGKGNLFRGIVAEAIADSGYGKVQVHGYCSYAKVLVADTSVAVTSGFPLMPSTNAQSLVPAVATTAALTALQAGYGFVSALATVAVGSTTVPVASKVFIRAL